MDLSETTRSQRWSLPKPGGAPKSRAVTAFRKAATTNLFWDSCTLFIEGELAIMMKNALCAAAILSTFLC
jgi:hypothetical protein